MRLESKEESEVPVMATAIAPRLPKSVASAPQPKCRTCAEFHNLGDQGFFEGQRAMLIDGIILEQGPMNPPHAIAATKTEDLIRDTFGKQWHVRVAKPLEPSLDRDPEPDVAVVPCRPSHDTSHPTSAGLTVEVSDSPPDFDRSEKANLYAAGSSSTVGFFIQPRSGDRRSQG